MGCLALPFRRAGIAACDGRSIGISLEIARATRADPQCNFSKTICETFVRVSCAVHVGYSLASGLFVG